MIVSNHHEVTAAVLSELERAPDARFKEIFRALVIHLHEFARDARLTEAEFHRAAEYVAKLGQMTNESDNEVIVMSGALGFSSLICLLNNGNNGQTETTANMLGPYWRNNSPLEPNGGSIVRAPTPGDPVFVKAWVVDAHGRPVVDAEVDVWHASTEGLYENQDPEQADMNLRGRFTTDAEGRIWLRSVKPTGYGIPVNGPTGELLRAQGRHNMRPAHVHFLIYKPGFKTQFSQLYSHDCPYLETDVAFGVTRALVGHYTRHENEPAPWGDELPGPWYSLEQHFVLEPGIAKWPREPITGKASGARPDAVSLRDERISAGFGSALSGDKRALSPRSLSIQGVFAGPRVERRRVLSDGSTYWGTVLEDGSRLRLDDGRLVDLDRVAHLPPCEPTKIICVHLSYRSRAIETRNDPRPAETPTYFMKPITVANGHGGEVVKPADCLYLNYEGELAVVIGKVCRNVTPDEAWDYVAGFAPALDMGLQSFRDTDAGSMLRVKGADGLMPIGPGLVSGVDVLAQTLRTYRNGRIVQEAHIGEEMIWGPHYMIADIARHITLVPGDVILTGTPCHSRSLDPGDTIECEITAIGRVSARVVAGPIPRASELSIGHQPTDSAEVRRVALGFDERVPERFKSNYRAAK